MQRKPTIGTVAARAGVAVSTVSRYFNGHYVSGEVRARLAEVIAELGYSRSSAARNLSLGRKGSIGVVVDSSQDLWFTQLLTGIEEELASRDLSLMLASLELRGRYDASVVAGWIRDRRVDGIVMAKSRRRERPLLRAAAEARLPVALVAPDETLAGMPVVRCDNYGAGAAVAHHLAGLGHTSIAFAGGPRRSYDSRQRGGGLRDGLNMRGILLDPKLTSFLDSYDARSGAEFARKLLRNPLPVTAMALGNDALALGFMRVAQQRGVRIPHDLSIVGFDDIPEGALLWPGLTTVAQPTREMGRAACSMLFDAIDGRSPGQLVDFPTRLVVRESTGTAPPRPAKAFSRR